VLNVELLNNLIYLYINNSTGEAVVAGKRYDTHRPRC